MGSHTGSATSHDTTPYMALALVKAHEHVLNDSFLLRRTAGGGDNALAYIVADDAYTPKRSGWGRAPSMRIQVFKLPGQPMVTSTW
eukprot:1622768-Rhodomonas_salina.1